ncbi:MAG: prepilin-type N-terminal cleavage/methylation domain-containing protein, partial [Candidatus Andersenbacteria bacterium]
MSQRVVYVGRQGFTLIELLIVIAIIGILAILVLGAAGRSRQLAQDRKVQSGVGQIRWQAEIAYDNNGGSYEDWVEDKNIQDQLYILLNDINTIAGIIGSCGDYTSCPEEYSTVLRYSQEQEYCISAPKASE